MYSRLGMILLQLAKFFTMKVFLHEISSFCKVPAYTYVVYLLFLTSFEQTYLTKIHTGHQAITKCWWDVSQSVWWPGNTKDLDDLNSKCLMCCRQNLQHSEPLLTSLLPDHSHSKMFLLIILNGEVIWNCFSVDMQYPKLLCLPMDLSTL